MSVSAARRRRNLLQGLSFLAPNIVGFLSFTLLPLLFAFVLAFTNWDLKLHNMFKPDEPLKFVGLDNFIRLFREHDFWRYLGNTLYLMMSIPFTIAASLCAAMLLSKDTRGGGGRVYLGLLATAGLIVSALMLTVIGLGGTAMMILLTGLACTFLVAGTLGSITVYRTLFYLPHFTAGVATYILWQKLYNPKNGPINAGLAPLLARLDRAVDAAPPQLFSGGMWLLLVLMALALGMGLRQLRLMWRDGELGYAAAILPALLMLTPTVVAANWSYTRAAAWLPATAAVIWLVWQGAMVAVRGRDFAGKPSEGIGGALVLGGAFMVLQFVLLGLVPVLGGLPARAATLDGLAPPDWLADYDWAKPAIMIMAFWGAVGSNNMLLYLAALTNVPAELYEAADIDGASRLQRFWNITWPQLAPTTFFIVVMAMIGGLQGGFEMARTMTQGGPAGSTTVLSYFIYMEGFETGRLGYSSAIAWALFAMVFAVTMFNIKFGNRYVND